MIFSTLLFSAVLRRAGSDVVSDCLVSSNFAESVFLLLLWLRKAYHGKLTRVALMSLMLALEIVKQLSPRAVFLLTFFLQGLQITVLCPCKI